MKNRYYFYGFFILLLLIFIYHFFAAHQAEKQISEALQEQARQSGGAYTISYSDIDVSAFSGDVELEQLNFTFGDYIHRASALHFDLSYIDFLRIYLGGADYGLRKINNMRSIITDLSILFRPEVREVKLDTIHLDYEGNLYDLLRFGLTENSLENEHQLTGSGKKLSLSQPKAPWGQLDAESFAFSSAIPAQTKSVQNLSQLFLKFSSATWNPPQNFQNKYGFFLRGFGYRMDEIPIDSTQFNLSRADTVSSFSMEADLYTDLFHARAESRLMLDSNRFSRSTFQNGTLILEGISEEFKNFLNSAEQLFGVKLSGTNGQIARFSGPVLKPQISAASRAQ